MNLELSSRDDHWIHKGERTLGNICGIEEEREVATEAEKGWSEGELGSCSFRKWGWDFQGSGSVQEIIDIWGGREWKKPAKKNGEGPIWEGGEKGELWWGQMRRQFQEEEWATIKNTKDISNEMWTKESLDMVSFSEYVSMELWEQKPYKSKWDSEWGVMKRRNQRRAEGTTL